MTSSFEEAKKSARAIKVNPTPLMGEERPPEPYPVDALGENMAKPVRAIIQRVQVPDVLAVHAVLAAVALASQGHAMVRLPTHQTKPLSLFLGTVADSSDRKSTADEIALMPIAEYELELNADYQIQKQVHASVHAIWKASKDAIAKDFKGQPSSVIEEEVRKLGQPPVEPPRPAFVVPPGSTQGVIDMLDKGYPSVGLFVNEGGSWLGSWGMQDEQRTATISAYSTMWDGQPVKTLTKGEGFRFMPNRAFSFHVMFQSVYVEQMFGDEEMRGQGFLSRLLAAKPASIAGTRFKDLAQAEPEHVAEDIADYHERLARIIRSPLPIDPEFPQNGLSRRRVLTFATDAEKLLWDFYNHIERQQAEGSALADLRGFAGKSIEHVGRLAGCIHVFDFGLRDTVITAQTVSRAIRLMNFYLNEALRLVECGKPDPKLVKAEKLSRWLADQWEHDAISATLIQRRGPLGRKLTADEAKDLCAILVRHDHISRIESGETIDGARYREAWRVHVGR